MELSLTKTERDLIKNAIAQKEIEKPSFLRQTMILITGGIFLIAPILFIMNNISRSDHILQTIGIYLGIMVFIGIELCFYYVHVVKQSKPTQTIENLNSAIKKIILKTQIEIA